MSENTTTMREALEKTARRFHADRQYAGAQEHKWWKFENCPALNCREARAALGIPDAVMPPIHDTPAPREPGQEG